MSIGENLLLENYFEINIAKFYLRNQQINFSPSERREECADFSAASIAVINSGEPIEESKLMSSALSLLSEKDDSMNVEVSLLSESILISSTLSLFCNNSVYVLNQQKLLIQICLLINYPSICLTYRVQSSDHFCSLASQYLNNSFQGVSFCRAVHATALAID